MTYLKYTVYLYSMNDIYKKNKPSRQPMAVRHMNTVQIESPLNYMWIDRLVTSMYYSFISQFNYYFSSLNDGFIDIN